jgi:hypothetical protein
MKQQQQQQQQWASHLEKQRQEKEVAAFQSIKVLTDILVSLSVGTSATLLLLDAEKETMRQDFENAPLVQGRSVVSDVCCKDIIAISDQHPGLSTSLNDDVNLASFSKFASNCRLRGYS